MLSLSLALMTTTLAMATASHREPPGPPGRQQPGEAEVLTSLLQLERAEVALYRRLAAYPALSPAQRELADFLAYDEGEHLRALQQALGADGHGVPEESSSQADTPAGVPEGEGSLQWAARHEEIVGSAYVHAAGALEPGPALDLVVSILSVEGRHAALLRELAGQDPLSPTPATVSRSFAQTWLLLAAGEPAPPADQPGDVPGATPPALAAANRAQHLAFGVALYPGSALNPGDRELLAAVGRQQLAQDALVHIEDDLRPPTELDPQPRDALLAAAQEALDRRTEAYAAATADATDPTRRTLLAGVTHAVGSQAAAVRRITGRPVAVDPDVHVGLEGQDFLR